MEELCEGTRELVELLNQNGFRTTDSGDGSHFVSGMGCAIQEPMVVIQLDDNQSIRGESNRLQDFLMTNGVESPSIQASYDPSDGIAVILLLGALSADLLARIEGSDG